MTDDEIIFWHSKERGQREMRTGDRFHQRGDPRWWTFIRSWGGREVLASLGGRTEIIHLDSIATIDRKVTAS